MVGIIAYFARSMGESITHANALAAFLYDKQRPTTWLFARKIIAYSFMLTPFWYVKYSAVLDRFIFHMFVFCGLPRVFSAAPPSFQILEFSLTLRTGLAETCLSEIKLHLHTDGVAIHFQYFVMFGNFVWINGTQFNDFLDIFWFITG